MLEFFVASWKEGYLSGGSGDAYRSYPGTRIVLIVKSRRSVHNTFYMNAPQEKDVNASGTVIIFPSSSYEFTSWLIRRHYSKPQTSQ